MLALLLKVIDSFFSFGVHFTDEQSCRLHYKAQRDKEGVVCNRCGGRDHYWLQNKWSYQCKSCNSRTSLRSGTIMENSKLSFMTWYKTIFLMSTTKKGFFSKEIQRQLGLKHYEPVWAKVLEDHKAEGTDQVFEKAIDDEQTIVFTDKSTSYVNIADYVEIHMSEKSSKTTTKETLKWVHIAISNAKRNFEGTYHKIKKKYLQLYLNEFVYKLNRRYFGEKIFDRLVIASITTSGH